MATPCDEPISGGGRNARIRAWLPPASVILGCLLGCVLPAIAYGEALAALSGFGVVRRRWAVVLILVPSALWLGAAWTRAVTGELTRPERMAAAAALLGAQLGVAALVSGVIRLFVSRRKPSV